MEGELQMKLKDVQNKSFELLCIIDDICKKENIRYFLHAGTELGAVREKDIIPWDDDVDIKVLLEDYPAFKEAMIKNLPAYIKIIEPCDLAPAFYDFMVRILDTRYLLRKETEEDKYYNNWQNHIGVDIFLQYRIPAARIPRMIAYSRLMFWYGLGMGHRYRLNYDKYPGFYKIVVILLSSIGKGIDINTIWKNYYNLITSYNKSQSNLAMRNSMKWDGMVCTDWMDQIIHGVLRGREFPIPAGYDAELTAYYGDYMNPPKDRNDFNQHLDEEDRYKD